MNTRLYANWVMLIALLAVGSWAVLMLLGRRTYARPVAYIAAGFPGDPNWIAATAAATKACSDGIIHSTIPVLALVVFGVPVTIWNISSSMKQPQLGSQA